MLLNKEWVKNRIRGEIKKFLEKNENELTTTQNLWDTAKSVLKGSLYLKRIETAEINNQPQCQGTLTQPPGLPWMKNKTTKT